MGKSTISMAISQRNPWIIPSPPAHRPQEEQQGRNTQRRGDDRKGAGRGVAHVPRPAALEGGGRGNAMTRPRWG